MSLTERKYERHMQKQMGLDLKTISLKLRPLPDKYQNPFRLNDCDVCYNPLSLDLYNDCTYMCKYCFIRNRLMSLYSAFYDNWKPDKVRPCNFSVIEKKFKRAFSRAVKVSGEVKALRQGVPIHFGVLTDNFQPIEKHHRLTLKFLEFLKENYPDYPLILSTKSDLPLDRKYLRAISELEHVILQVSFCTTNEKTSKLLDGFAPTPNKRLQVLKTYKFLGIRTVMRMAPIICPITDKELYRSIHDAVEIANVDAVLMKGFFFGANKTVSKFFLNNFGVDIYKFYKDSGTIPYDGCNVCYHKQKQNIFIVKAINLCESLGIAGIADTILSPIVSTMKHCCGGDGLKGFNPHNYSDLEKAGNFNLSNCRYWLYKIRRQGKMTYEEFDALPVFNKEHKNFVKDYWEGGMENAWCTFLKQTNIRKSGECDYKFDYRDEFFRFLIGLKREKVLLLDGESMTEQQRFVREA